jgi:hypothetical protein
MQAPLNCQQEWDYHGARGRVQRHWPLSLEFKLRLDKTLAISLESVCVCVLYVCVCVCVCVLCVRVCVTTLPPGEKKESHRTGNKTNKQEKKTPLKFSSRSSLSSLDIRKTDSILACPGVKLYSVPLCQYLI